jgi:DNA-binding response OmpR family regulator
VETQKLMGTLAATRPPATVLLVEGQLDQAARIAKALLVASYQVRQARDGAAAASILGRETPDLIAINLILPDVDGLVLCSLVKEVLDVPVLLYGQTDPGRSALLARELGADDLVEDSPTDELVARLGKLRRRPG